MSKENGRNMKDRVTKVAAAVAITGIMAGSTGCDGEFATSVRNFFNSGSNNTSETGKTTVRPPRTTAPRTTETTTQLSEIEQKMNLAPSLEGATKVIQEIDGYQRVTYVAESGNPYGAEAGTYLGEFKKEVELEGKETGGVALIPSVVEKLLNDALAKIPEGEDKLKVVIPLDITTMSSSGRCEVNSISHLETDISLLLIDFNESLNLVNTNFGKDFFVTSTGSYTLKAKKDGNTISVDNLASIVSVSNLKDDLNVNKMASFLYLISRDLVPENFKKEVSFGDTFGIGEIRSELVIGLGGMNIESLNISDLLFLKNSIVFISSK